MRTIYRLIRGDSAGEELVLDENKPIHNHYGFLNTNNEGYYVLCTHVDDNGDAVFYCIKSDIPLGDMMQVVCEMAFKSQG